MTVRTLLIAGAALAACGTPAPLPTIKGPEATDLLGRVSGTVIWSRPVGGIVGHAIPGRADIVIRPYWQDSGGPRQDYPNEVVLLVGGPDESGRIGYVARTLSALGRQDVTLRVVGVDGVGDRLVARLTGDPGESLAVAPHGGRVAFLSGVQSAAIVNRPYYLGRGTLEVWDIESRRQLPLGRKALDTPMSWFPDGTRLAYVDAVERAALPALPQDFEGLGDFARSSHVPAIHVLDTASGRAELVQLGTDPVVSTDGKSMLMRNLHGGLRKMDLTRGVVLKVKVPGRQGTVIAVVDGRYVLYKALPTEGSPIVRSPYGSFRAGLQMITVKLADLDTGRFQTVVPVIDPRWSVSFGGTGSARGGAP